jgi:magnesium transporter
MPLSIHIMENGAYRVSSDPSQIADLIARKDVSLWIDADEQTDGVRELLLDKLQLHSLVIEDIFSDRLTPKVEEYENFLYLVMHGVRRDGETPEDLCTVELDVVIGENWVFTHHTIAMRTVDDIREDLKRNPKVLARGPAFIAHALIDKLTDYYLPVMDRFDDEISDLEKDVVENLAPDAVPRIFAMRRSIQRLRRLSIHQRDTLQRLSRGEFDRIPESAIPFYRDVYDHFVRIADLTDSYRELLTSSLETYMSVTANRTNEIMKVLAIMSTLMLPLTFIAGVYGMNFEHMPELKWKYGYLFALGLMLATVLLLLWYFRRKGWIGRPR